MANYNASNRRKPLLFKLAPESLNIEHPNKTNEDKGLWQGAMSSKSISPKD
jgi:hypothetical protein